MKKAVFITHPDLKPVVYEHPWHKQGRVYNSKSLDLPPENERGQQGQFFRRDLLFQRHAFHFNGQR